MYIQLNKEDSYFTGLLLVITFVYSINLGLMPLLADEPIRALVSLEMLLNKNFIYPTLGGLPYLNKPPLFNWMLACTSFNSSKVSEWYLRVIPVFCFLSTAILHYIVCSKHVSKQIALWSSIAFLTCGRILFYDSLMAYIDPVFSLVILANFYLILIFSRINRLIQLFVYSYILCSIAFFLKGLPACTFQIFTLTGIFIYRNKFKQLVSFSHLAGICIFILSVSCYYYEYGSFGSVEKALLALISQSTQRTPLSTSIIDTITHIIGFPFQYMFDFLPFSLFFIFCFNKNGIQTFKENDFVFSSILIIGVNIWLYWLSPETRARYLFMFLPLFFTISFYAYQQYRTSKIEQLIRYAILLLSFCIMMVLIVLPFLQRFNFITTSFWISFFSICLLLLLTFAFYKRKFDNVLMLAMVLIVIKVNFNLFILPLRKKEAPESVNKNIGIQLAHLTQNHHLYTLYGAPINDDIRFYATLHKGEIIYNKNEKPKDNSYYLTTREGLDFFHLTPIYQFSVTHENRTLYLVKK